MIKELTHDQLCEMKEILLEFREDGGLSDLEGKIVSIASTMVTVMEWLEELEQEVRYIS